MSEKYPVYNPNPGIAVCPPGPSINSGFVGDQGVEFPPEPGFNPDYIGKDVVQMPPTAPPMEVTTHQPMPQVNLGSISDGDIREAVVEYTSHYCCYGNKFIRDTVFPETTDTPVYHYMLESFGEKRETSDRIEPYRGQIIDGPENGVPPGAWDMVIKIPALFQDSQGRAEVPHTAYVKECYRCVGNRRIRCESCYGRGGNSCMLCLGSGRRNSERCTSCSGTGRNMCWSCNGTGQVKCDICDGTGRLKHYKQLVITWKNHVDNFVSATYALPKHLIVKASGRKVFNEQNLKVFPVSLPDNMLVSEASKSLIAQHERAFPQEFIRMQRHSLRIVPLTKVKYTWKRKAGDFYVYGFDKKVHFENYPQKCCCCTCC